MPQMADIVVKKADNTTNVTFVQKVPSSGDKVPCVWTQDGASTYRDQRPTLSAVTQWNGARTARRVRVACDFPVVRIVNSVPVVVHRVPVETSIAVPTGLTDAEANECVAQYTNALASSLMRLIMAEGYAAT